MTRTLLYDGTCGLCARSVQFVLRHEGANPTLRFAPLQGSTAAAVLRQHPQLEGVDSVVFVETDPGGHQRVHMRSDAVIRVLRHLGGFWGVLGSVASVVPRFLRNGAYDVVARRRYSVFGRDQSCLLPTEEQRARFDA